MNISRNRIVRHIALAAALSGAASMAAAMHSPAVKATAAPSIQWVFAGDETVPHLVPATRLSREQVRAELRASRERGDWVFVGDAQEPRSHFAGTLTRDQVRNESLASRARGEHVFEGDTVSLRPASLRPQI